MLLTETTPCFKEGEWSKIQKYHCRVLFPKAFNLTAAKKLHKVSYPFIAMFDIKHQLNDYIKISTQNLFHYLYFCLYCSLFLCFCFPSLHLLVFFSIYHLFSLPSTHSSSLCLVLISFILFQFIYPFSQYPAPMW